MIHSGVYGFNGNTRLHVILRCQNLKPKVDTLQHFSGETILPSIDWTTAYYFGIEQTQNFSEFYSHWFIKSYPSLNVDSFPNLMGNLDICDVGVHGVRVCGDA